MGRYEDLVRQTVEEVLLPGEPVSIDRLARAVGDRMPLRLVDLTDLLVADPRFVEVAPGMWMRRRDGPEAGVRSRPRRPLVGGSAAAAAAPPEPHVRVDAVARS